MKPDTFDSTFPDTRWHDGVCQHAMNTIAIIPDSRVIPCCRYIELPDYSTDYSNCLNILDGGMEKILSDTTLLKYKHLKMEDIIRQNPECANCGLLWKCNAK